MTDRKWARAVWELVSHRKSAREAKEASDAMMAKLDESIAQNQLLLAKMDAMIGKPEAADANRKQGDEQCN